VIIQGTAPNTITGNLKQALEGANWLAVTDGAAIALAERLALALDTAFDSGELKEVPAMAQRFTAILQQLHLTVETRTQGNKEEEDNGEEFRGNYLRLLATPSNESKPKPSKRGSSS
jgi:hypothetical protein